MIVFGVCATCEESGRPARVVLTRHGECSVCGSRAVMLTPALNAKGRIVSQKVAAMRDLVGAAQLGDISEPLLDQLELTFRSVKEDIESLRDQVHEEEQVLDQERRRQQALAAEWNLGEMYGPDPKKEDYDA